MHDQFLPTLLLNHHIEGRWSFTLQDALLSVAPPCLLVSEGHGLNAPHEIGERGVDEQVTKRVAMSSCHKLYTALSDSTRRGGFQLCANLIYDDYLGHVVFDRFDHYRVLFCCACHLHAASTTNAVMGNISITRDFIRGIDDNHAFIGFVREDASYFT